MKVLGVNDAKIFLSFHQDLKDAVHSRDLGKLALLLRYPFRVNDDRGAYYLHDAASFSGRVDQIFTPPVRDSILNQDAKAVWCNYAGIMFGNGVVWIEPRGESFGIASINVPDRSGSLRRPSNEVAFVCNAEKHRVVVDRPTSTGLRYRAWNTPRSLAEKPDLEIAKGKENLEGTGPCVHAIWQFSSGSAEFTVEEAGACDTDIPSDAVGRLVVSRPEKESLEWWCH